MTRLRFYVGLVTKDGRVVDKAVIERMTQLVSQEYGGLTMYQTQGAYEGQEEPSVVIEVLEDGLNRCSAATMAGSLRKLADQSTVLWTREEVAGGFV